MHNVIWAKVALFTEPGRPDKHKSENETKFWLLDFPLIVWNSSFHLCASCTHQSTCFRKFLRLFNASALIRSIINVSINAIVIVKAKRSWICRFYVFVWESVHFLIADIRSNTQSKGPDLIRHAGTFIYKPLGIMIAFQLATVSKRHECRK